MKNYSHSVGRAKRASDQTIEVTVKKPALRFTVYIESVKASVVKDTFSLSGVVALWAVLWWLGAQPGFIAGVLSVFLSLIGLKDLAQWATRRGARVKFLSVNPQDAVAFIEQEIAEALVEAKQKKDMI